MEMGDLGLEEIILERSGLLVRDIMQVASQEETGSRGQLRRAAINRNSPTVIPADEFVVSAAKLMGWRRCSGLLVQERGKVVGVITKRDIEGAYMSWLKSHL
jgi:CBS domain-containing protein